MEEKKHCKWYNDEICTNGESPCVADYCPVVEYPELCKHRETIKHRVSWKAKFFKSQEEIKRLTEERNSLEDDRFAVCHKLRQAIAENDELQKQVDELLNRRIEPKIFQCHADALENCPKVEQAVKDTANKIFRQVLELYQGLSKVEKETMTFEWKLLDLAVEYGVEVE